MIILDKFIYSRRAGVIFAYIPKVACTNWKCILRYLDGHEDYLNAQLAHDRMRSGLDYLSTNPHGEILLRNPAIPKLTCVRNPFSRILSAYLNKVKPFAFDNATADRDPYFFMVFQKINSFRQLSYPRITQVTFTCFLNWIEFSGDPLTLNEHWIPQTNILGRGEVCFEYIGRLENIHEDAKMLLSRMGCDIPFPSQAAVSFPPTNADTLVKYHYTPYDYDAVRRIYADDFSILKYDPFLI